VPVESLQAREGTYELHWAYSMKIRSGGDHLIAQPTGQPPARFEPMSATRFYNAAMDTEIEFSLDGAELILYQTGAAVPLRRQ
jgi:hypothetical protein